MRFRETGKLLCCATVVLMAVSARAGTIMPPCCLIISEVVDGDRAGGNPKFVEITNTGSTNYTFSNGGIIVQSPQFQEFLAVTTRLLKAQGDEADDTGMKFDELGRRIDKAGASYNRYLAMAMERGVSIPKAANFGRDIALTVESAGASGDLTAQLKDAEAALARLTPALRQQIDAGIKMNASNKDIVESLNGIDRDSTRKRKDEDSPQRHEDHTKDHKENGG